MQIPGKTRIISLDLTHFARPTSPPEAHTPALMLTEPVDIERYLAHSAKIDTSDINWEEASQAGLTPEEKFILTYFSDIEGQTIFYLRDLLNTKAVYDPDSAAFLTMWNYEEYFHAKALSDLLGVCGHPLNKKRISQVRSSSQWSETALAWLARIFSKLLPDSFLTLYMAWGAINEISTLRGYEELHRRTNNPALKILCERIARQERRHFAWYFNSAAERLTRSRSARWFVRSALRLFWTPVGAGVKRPEEVARLTQSLFPGHRGAELARDIDERIASLPGLSGLRLLSSYLLDLPHFRRAALFAIEDDGFLARMPGKS